MATTCPAAGGALSREAECDPLLELQLRATGLRSTEAVWGGGRSAYLAQPLKQAFCMASMVYRRNSCASSWFPKRKCRAISKEERKKHQAGREEFLPALQMSHSCRSHHQLLADPGLNPSEEKEPAWLPTSQVPPSWQLSSQ